MLETAASPLLRAVASAFAHAEDAAHAALPLEGARATLRLAADLRADAARDAFAAFLVDASGVGTRPDGMATQGAEAVRTLVELAARDTDALGARWAPAIEVICRVDALRSRGDSDAREDARDASAVRAPLRTANDDTFKGDDSDSKDVAVSDSKDVAVSGSEDVAVSGSEDVAVGATIARVAPNAAERRLGAWLSSDEGIAATNEVFSASTRLDTDEAIVFVDALARVARVHLWADADASSDGNAAARALVSPRPYALAKLIEVSAANAGRVRPVWTRVWSTASRVLVEACGHPDSSASSIAADGIRRVARAALDKADATGAGAAAGEAAARPFLDAFVLAEDADTRARLVEGLGARRRRPGPERRARRRRRRARRARRRGQRRVRVVGDEDGVVGDGVCVLILGVLILGTRVAGD